MKIKVTTESPEFFKDLSFDGKNVRYGESFQTEIGIEAKSITPASAGAFDSAEVYEFIFGVGVNVAYDVLKLSVNWLFSKMKKHQVIKLEIEGKEVELTEVEIRKAVEAYRNKADE